MGHKGVSKRKPKKEKDNLFSKTNMPPKDAQPVQPLMKNNETVLNKNNSNPAGSNKKNKKGK